MPVKYNCGNSRVFHDFFNVFLLSFLLFGNCMRKRRRWQSIQLILFGNGWLSVGKTHHSIRLVIDEEKWERQRKIDTLIKPTNYAHVKNIRFDEIVYVWIKYFSINRNLIFIVDFLNVDHINLLTLEFNYILYAMSHTKYPWCKFYQ